jgi:hypothetical protein
MRVLAYRNGVIEVSVLMEPNDRNLTILRKDRLSPIAAVWTRFHRKASKLLDYAPLHPRRWYALNFTFRNNRLFNYTISSSYRQKIWRLENEELERMRKETDLARFESHPLFAQSGLEEPQETLLHIENPHIEI